MTDRLTTVQMEIRRMRDALHALEDEEKVLVGERVRVLLESGQWDGKWAGRTATLKAKAATCDALHALMKACTQVFGYHDNLELSLTGDPNSLVIVVLDDGDVSIVASTADAPIGLSTRDALRALLGDALAARFEATVWRALIETESARLVKLRATLVADEAAIVAAQKRIVELTELATGEQHERQ